MQLTSLFRELFEDPSIVLTPATTAADVGEWDSMNHITLVVEVERRFSIRFKTAELEELKNIGDFIDVISHKLSVRA